MDDHAVIEKARRARNGAKFDRLYSGDSSDYADDESAADLAFVSLLTFYIQDEAQLDRIFRQSGRYRPKWERADYRQWTIEKALQRATFYEPSRPAIAAVEMPPAEPMREISATPDGCVVELARIAELEQALAERDEKLARLQERVRNQDDELHRLRRIAALQAQVMKNPEMADGPKLMLLALAPEIASVKSGAGAPVDPSTPDPRVDGNAIKVNCTAMAERIGCHPDVAGKRISKLVDANLFQKRYRPLIIRNEETGQTMNGGKELLLVTQHDTLEAILEAGTTAATPGRANQGGARVKRCKAHPDALLVKRTDVTLACSDCGEIIDQTVTKQTIDPNRQIIGSGAPPALPVEDVLISDESSVRVGYHEAREWHFGIDNEVDADESDPNRQPVGSGIALCRDCARPLRNDEERCAGRHSYGCLNPTVPRSTSPPLFAAGDD